MKAIKGRKFFDSIDLIKFVSGRLSLKELAIGLNWNNIQELPYDPNKQVTEDEMGVLKKYCQNDVAITYELYKHFQESIELRVYLDIEYSEAKKAVGFSRSFLTMSESEIAENLMGVLYCYEK